MTVIQKLRVPRKANVFPQRFVDGHELKNRDFHSVAQLWIIGPPDILYGLETELNLSACFRRTPLFCLSILVLLALL